MTSFSVVYDACVLYPAPLRDLLMHLALTDLYRARWTDEIHEEWIRNVLRSRPDLTREQLDRTRALMDHCALNPARVLAAIAQCRRSLKNPPKTAEEYLDTLLQQGLPETVSQLRQWLVAI